MHHFFDKILTGVGRNHSVDAGHDDLEKSDKFAVVLGTNVERTNLGKTFEGNISEIGNLEELQRIITTRKLAWEKSNSLWRQEYQ